MLRCAVCYFLHYTVFYYFHPISKASIPECKSIFCRRNIRLSGLVRSAQTHISSFHGLVQISYCCFSFMKLEEIQAFLKKFNHKGSQASHFLLPVPSPENLRRLCQKEHPT